MKDIDVAWLAGLFEGEGNIYCKNNCIQVTIAMTDLDVIDKVDLLVTGRRYERSSGEKRQTLYIWRLYGEPAYNFINIVLPYLGERRSLKALEVIEIHESEDRRRGQKQRTAQAVFELTNQGLSRKEISERLGIGVNYVSTLRKVVS